MGSPTSLFGRVGILHWSIRVLHGSRALQASPHTSTVSLRKARRGGNLPSATCLPGWLKPRANRVCSDSCEICCLLASHKGSPLSARVKVNGQLGNHMSRKPGGATADCMVTFALSFLIGKGVRFRGSPGDPACWEGCFPSKDRAG